jgi:alkanesulfonate monooxygenase SsuD/methylene tetrahydromethanopterin reductase-like flavin-dependent oxidoreductase (luciferase family)
MLDTAACAAVGRDPATLERTAGVLVEAAPQVATDWWGRWGVTPLAGPPEELAEELRAFAREGISHLQVMLLPNTPAGIAAFAPVLELLDRA